MGYLSSGFAFSGTPEWEEIRTLFHSFSIRGYRNRSSAVSLLDVWRPAKADDARFPFSSGPIEPEHMPHSLPGSPAASAFDEICDILRSAETVEYSQNWLCIPAFISSATRLQTLAFTADDDVFDYAALADSGSISRMGCRIGSFDIVFDGRTFRVTPYVGEDHEEHVGDEEDLLAALSELKDVQVLPAREAAGGFRRFLRSKKPLLVAGR